MNFIDKKLSKKRKLSKQTQTGIIYIQTTRNNTILTLTDLEGNTKAWASSGTIGFKNSRKSTPYAGQAAAEKLAFRARDLGFSTIQAKVKGIGFSKESVVKTLQKSGLSVIQVENITPLPHNGCRPPLKRRV